MYINVFICVFILYLYKYPPLFRSAVCLVFYPQVPMDEDVFSEIMGDQDAMLLSLDSHDTTDETMRGGAARR